MSLPYSTGAPAPAQSAEATPGPRKGKRLSTTIERQIAMLRAIPREPQRRTVSDLAQKLCDEGHDVTVRTVQRDLNELSRLFGLTCDIEGRTQYWFYPKAHKGFDIPGMGAPEALVFRMAELYLHRALPAAQVQHLEPYFSQARSVIEHEGVPLARWRKRVRVIERGPRLQIPPAKDGVIDTVHDALLHEKRIMLRYRKRGETAINEYEASIHALVIRDGIVYAVVTLWDYEDLLHLAMHRAESATLLDKPAHKLKHFDLDDYLTRQATFSYPAEGGTQVKLALSVSQHVYEHLAERPLSDDQTLDQRNDGRWDVKATVLETDELRWWLLGFGSAVEVVGPAALRKRVRSDLQETLARYTL